MPGSGRNGNESHFFRNVYFVSGLAIAKTHLKIEWTQQQATTKKKHSQNVYAFHQFRPALIAANGPLQVNLESIELISNTRFIWFTGIPLLFFASFLSFSLSLSHFPFEIDNWVIYTERKSNKSKLDLRAYGMRTSRCIVMYNQFKLCGADFSKSNGF